MEFERKKGGESLHTTSRQRRSHLGRSLLSPAGKALCIGGPRDGLHCSSDPDCSFPDGTCVVPPIPNGDHYKCYDVVDTVAAHTVVELNDQFDIEFGPEFVEVFDARYFCNPVEKEHNAQVFPISNPDRHLTCYDIFPQIPLNTTLDADQQFGPSDDLVVLENRFLCVPTEKWIKTPPIQVPALGSWGIAALCGLLILATMAWYAHRRAERGELRQ